MASRPFSDDVLARIRALSRQDRQAFERAVEAVAVRISPTSGAWNTVDWHRILDLLETKAAPADPRIYEACLDEFTDDDEFNALTVAFVSAFFDANPRASVRDARRALIVP